MSPYQIQGQNWTLQGDQLDIFDHSAHRLLDTPEPLHELIENVIEADRMAGKDDIIAYVGIGARQACGLFVQQKLTGEHLKDAEETGETTTVVLELAGKPRKVVIRAMPPYNIATFDAQHRVV